MESRLGQQHVGPRVYRNHGFWEMVSLWLEIRILSLSRTTSLDLWLLFCFCFFNLCLELLSGII